MNDTARIHYLAGEASALRAFCLAMINVHSDLARLAAEFERLSETQIGVATGQSVQDAYLDGQRSTIEDLRKHMAQDWDARD
jgi:hypothetical protein